MKPVPLLLLVLSLATVAEAQDTPPAAPSPSAEPGEVVKPAIPVVPMPSEKPQTVTQDQIRQIETALKKQMMLVGLGCGVAGLLVGMMIGRKTAPRTMGRRF
jgi:hypothetical protein